jgi:hypothetical protein
MRDIRGCVMVTLLLLPAVALGQTVDARRTETYESVTVGANGSLVITTSDKRMIVAPTEGGQNVVAHQELTRPR